MAILVAMLAAASAPLLANQQPACATRHEACAKTTQLKDCCCLGKGDPSEHATPAAAKTQITQPVADVTAASTRVPMPGWLRDARAVTATARSSPPDLITLFGTFLI